MLANRNGARYVGLCPVRGIPFSFVGIGLWRETWYGFPAPSREHPVED
jgi:hypothetical protein